MNAPEPSAERDRWRALIHRHVLGDLPDEDSRELENFLTAHREAREDFRLLCNLDAALRAAASAAHPMDEDVPPPAPVVFPRRRALVLQAAAALVVFGVAGWWWSMVRLSGDRLTLTDAADRVLWQERPGLTTESLQAGDRVQPGTLMVEGDGAGAVLTFQDGTRVTLTAGAELTWHADGGKRLYLRRGELSADVTPQPARRPMTVTTPNSKATVLGTTFSMTVQSDRTVLQVEKGLVAVRGLPDQKEVRVQAGQRLVAGVDPRIGVEVGRAPNPASSWRADLSDARRDPADAVWRRPGVLAATPVEYPDHRGAMTRFHRVRLPITWSESPRLTEQSRVKVRYRVSAGGSLGVGIVARDDHYRFQGVYQSYFPADAAEPDADGWREIEVPVAEMTGIQQHAGRAIPAGAQWRASVLFFASKIDDLDLEIAAAEFLTD